MWQKVDSLTKLGRVIVRAEQNSLEEKYKVKGGFNYKLLIDHTNEADTK